VGRTASTLSPLQRGRCLALAPTPARRSTSTSTTATGSSAASGTSPPVVAFDDVAGRRLDDDGGLLPESVEALRDPLDLAAAAVIRVRLEVAYDRGVPVGDVALDAIPDAVARDSQREETQSKDDGSRRAPVVIDRSPLESRPDELNWSSPRSHRPSVALSGRGGRSRVAP
jgi:hypothetical protein